MYHSNKNIPAMDVNDVKALIRSLVVSSTTPYSVPKLLKDFEEEAGVVMPIYNFRTPKAFLQSLTDTIQFVGQSPCQKIRLVENLKTQHISKLVQRQGRIHRSMDRFDHPDVFRQKQTMFKENNLQVANKVESNEKSEVQATEQLPTNNQPVKNVSSIKEVKSEENDKNAHGTSEGLLFDEHEIKSISDCGSPIRLVSRSKTKDCDNISDAGSQTSSNISSSTCLVNEGVKEKLKNLMKNVTQGIWCCDLLDLYKDCYKVSLEFKELGYRSLIDMVMELSEIFRCVRPGNGDWLLFDASKPPSQNEMDIHAVTHCNIPEEIEKNLLELINCHCENGLKPGIYLDDLLVLYFKKFGKRLNFTELGFPNIKSLLSKLDGQILRLVKDGYRFVIKSVVEQSQTNQETAVFPITPEDDMFRELFPADVVKQGEHFSTLDIEKYFVVNKKIMVNVADVCSPDEFYVQLKEFEQEFFDMCQSMQTFYNQNVNKYKMPDATIQPNQVCVGFYSSDDGYTEWQRSVIVKLKERDEVVLDFVDYGNRTRVNKGKLRFLHRDFFHLPVQSFPARLSFVKPVNGNEWPLDTCKIFLELVTVPVAEFHVLNIDFQQEKKVNGVIISIDDNKRINVNKALVDEGMALFENPKKVKHLRDKGVLEGQKLKKPLSASVKDSIPNDCKDKFLAPDNEESQIENENEVSSFNPNDDNKVQDDNSLMGMNSVQELFAVSSGTDDIQLNTHMAENTPILHMERNVYALAYCLMHTNEFVRKVAVLNLDVGLKMALNLARNMLEMAGVSNCK